MADLPVTIRDVPTPSVLIDLDKAKKNAQKMIDICQSFGVKLRPHMKTHKTVELGVLMTNGTKQRIEVSTMEEAEFYAKNGFDDILYAHPFISARIERCRNLAHSLNSFHVMIDNDHGLQSLLQSPLDNGKRWSVFLEIDEGLGRTGVQWDSEEVLTLARQLNQSPLIDFQGLYLYMGATYSASSIQEIIRMNKEGTKVLTTVCKRLGDNGIKCNILSIGCTPSCSHPDPSMNTLTEFHPGNYILYDIQQSLIGSCTRDEIAIQLTTRVLGHKPSTNILLIDCGFMALNHDGMRLNPDDFSTFKDNPDLIITGFSQEIGKVSTKSGEKLNYEKYPIGSQLFLYPWQACSTANQHTVYYVHCGDKITNIWKPVRGW